MAEDPQRLEHPRVIGRIEAVPESGVGVTFSWPGTSAPVVEFKYHRGKACLSMPTKGKKGKKGKKSKK